MTTSRSAVGSWERVIGLEVHVQLETDAKMFCGCRVEFGADPNTRVCPVCLGLPGALPVVNQHAVELAVCAALALGCDVHGQSVFARKNYFYPDLPKGYQISQYDRPLATRGSLSVSMGDGGPKSVRVRRVHLEEDAGKSLHDRFPGVSAIDLNRAGVPLIEIVTEPDLRSAAEARAFLGLLKRTLEYLGVSDCNMEEGSLRVDANVSVRRQGESRLATKTEVKNLNSFSQLEKALQYEATRHVEVLVAGGTVEHQTMLWDAARGRTRPTRGKEEVRDYRYFPEPDLPPLAVPTEKIAEIAKRLPELPQEKTSRLVVDYGLPEYDAEVLSASRSLADYFEAVAKESGDPRAASNWIMVELFAIANALGSSVAELGVEPKDLARTIALVEEGSLTRRLGRQVLRKMVETGETAEEIIAREGLRVVSDAGLIEALVAETLGENPGEVDRYRAGDQRLLAFFIGQVMRKSQGRADPNDVKERLLKRLVD